MHVDPRSPATVLARAPGYVYKRVRRWLVARRTERFFNRRPDHRALAAEEASSVVVDADRILFLCWGNICRSPMAAGYLGLQLADSDVDGVTVESAGLGRREDRASPDTAVEVASRYGVDLSDHRSRRLTQAMVEESDAIFVMDYNDYHDLTRRFPVATGRTFFLGAFTDGEATINDPHGEDRERFDRVYGRIVDAADGIVDAIHREGPSADRDRTANDDQSGGMQHPSHDEI